MTPSTLFLAALPIAPLMDALRTAVPTFARHVTMGPEVL